METKILGDGFQPVVWVLSVGMYFFFFLRLVLCSHFWSTALAPQGVGSCSGHSNPDSHICFLLSLLLPQ